MLDVCALGFNHVPSPPCLPATHSLPWQDLAHLLKLGAGQEVAARLGDAQRRAAAQQPVNHYAVLGVKPAATPGEIKAAYKRLALVSVEGRCWGRLAWQSVGMDGACMGKLGVCAFV